MAALTCFCLFSNNQHYASEGQFPDFYSAFHHANDDECSDSISFSESI